MAQDKQTDQGEFLNNVLVLTRSQLASAMSACTELEAALAIERKRGEELAARVAELESEKKAVTDK
jgi:uncharacterized protein with PIN domain